VHTDGQRTSVERVLKSCDASALTRATMEGQNYLGTGTATASRVAEAG